VLALLFALVFEPGVNRHQFGSGKMLVADSSARQPVLNEAMKVSTISYDIIDGGYQPELNTSVSGVSVSISRKFPNSVTFHMSDPASEPAKLRELIKELNMSAEYLVGYGKPVYLIRGLSAGSLGDFIARLGEIDPDIRVDAPVRTFVDERSTDLLDIHFVVRLVKR
jgi:hypothetical protein